MLPRVPSGSCLRIPCNPWSTFWELLFWAVCRSGRISWMGNTELSVPNPQHRNTGTKTLASGGGPKAVLDRILNG